MSLMLKNGNIFYRCDKAKYDACRRAGLSWDKTYQAWATPFSHIIKKVYHEEHPGITNLERCERENFRFSSQAECKSAGPLAPKGLTYRPYQLISAGSIIERGNTLLAEPMGVGKSVIAALVTNIKKPQRVLIICPASAKSVWRRELKTWLTYKASVAEIGSKFWNEGVNFSIINYDVLKKHRAILKAAPWDVVILDEAHALKNPKTERAREVFGGRKATKDKKGNRVLGEKVEPIEGALKLALTGTPIENKPVEIFYLLRYLNPHAFPNKQRFEQRYCDLHVKHGRWDNSGASHLDELQKLLRSSVMIRHDKSEILKDLPPKVRQVIVLDTNAPVRKNLKATGTLVNMEEFKRSIKGLTVNNKFGNADLGILRKELGIAKVPQIIAHLENCIEQSEKVIFFCWHKVVAKKVAAHFGSAAVSITGDTAASKRGATVDRFQTDKSASLFVGNIKAAGEAITLTASSHVVFGELDWVIGKNLQAEDRAHRIGQLNSVLIQYLVYDDSMDSYVANAVIEKQDVLEQALDNDWLL